MTRNLTHRCFWTFLGDWGWLEFTFTENSKKLVTEWVIISGPQLLAQLKVGPIIVGFFLTTHCCHDRWLIGIKGEGLALCDRETEYESKVLSFLRFHARPSWNLRKNLNFVFMSIGFFVAVGGFAWFDGWKETTITNPDNFKTIFVFLRFEIGPIEESSWGIKELVSQAKSKSQVSELQKTTELSI